MMCIYCKGRTQADTTEYIEKQGNFIIIIKNVPCEKCVQCGETYFSNTTVQTIEKILDGIKIIASEITVTIIDYAANQVA